MVENNAVHTCVRQTVMLVAVLLYDRGDFLHEVIEGSDGQCTFGVTRRDEAIRTGN